MHDEVEKAVTHLVSTAEHSCEVFTLHRHLEVLRHIRQVPGMDWGGLHSQLFRPHQIDYMFHGFETQNFDPGGRQKKKKKNHEYH